MKRHLYIFTLALLAIGCQKGLEGGENANVLESDGVLCAWQNYYNPKTRRCTFDLSFFIEEIACASTEP